MNNLEGAKIVKIREMTKKEAEQEAARLALTNLIGDS